MCEKGSKDHISQGHLTAEKLYAEACATLRHYSQASFTVRITSVIQGIVLLGVWCLAVARDVDYVVGMLPPVGMLFTFLLQRFHMGYFRATEFFYGIAGRLEADFADSEHRPFDGYSRQHSIWFDSFAGRYFTLNAPFTLVYIMFAAAFVLSVIHFTVKPLQ